MMPLTAPQTTGIERPPSGKAAPLPVCITFAQHSVNAWIPRMTAGPEPSRPTSAERRTNRRSLHRTPGLPHPGAQASSKPFATTLRCSSESQKSTRPVVTRGSHASCEIRVDPCHDRIARLAGTSAIAVTTWWQDGHSMPVLTVIIHHVFINWGTSDC